MLARIHPSPVVELNRAAALSMVEGPQKGLDLLDALTARGALSAHASLHAARAELLAKLGRRSESRNAFDRAIAFSRLAPERRLLERRKALLQD